MIEINNWQVVLWVLWRGILKVDRGINAQASAIGDNGTRNGAAAGLRAAMLANSIFDRLKTAARIDVNTVAYTGPLTPVSDSFLDWN